VLAPTHTPRRYRHLIEQWTEFWVAVAGAAAALTGLLFIAVSLRPRDIRDSTLMIGRARSAFYAFVTITIVSLLALMGSTTRWIGLAQAAVAFVTFGLSSQFTLPALRARRLNVPRALVYHAGLVIVAIGGLARLADVDERVYSGVEATGVTMLLMIALSNSWQLVLTHEDGTPA
jgi:hypothetical protein